jgi:hypothetical protein
VIVAPTAEAIRLVQKELPVAQSFFRILVDRHDDRLDVVVAPSFKARSVPDFGERLIHGGLSALSSYHLSSLTTDDRLALCLWSAQPDPF